MIRSQLSPGIRIIGRTFKKSLPLRGILLEKEPQGSLLIFVEQLGAETYIGYKRYAENDILIYDKEEILIDELLTSNNFLARQVGLFLLRKDTGD